MGKSVHTSLTESHLIHSSLYDTYVFDLDGTLLNTLDDLAASCNYALKQYGMPLKTVDEVRMMVGNGVKLLMIRAIPYGERNPQFEAAYQCFREHYLEHGLDTTAPYIGIDDMLQTLVSEGKRIAVVSNKFYEATQELVQHFFGNFIQVAIGERENIRKKPAPDTVCEALKQLGTTQTKTVYIGDSDVDIETAKNSKIPCLSVLWGFRDRDFLLQHGATELVETPSNI